MEIHFSFIYTSIFSLSLSIYLLAPLSIYLPSSFFICLYRALVNGERERALCILMMQCIFSAISSIISFLPNLNMPKILRLCISRYFNFLLLCVCDAIISSYTSNERLSYSYYLFSTFESLLNHRMAGDMMYSF